MWDHPEWPSSPKPPVIFKSDGEDGVKVGAMHPQCRKPRRTGSHQALKKSREVLREFIQPIGFCGFITSPTGRVPLSEHSDGRRLACQHLESRICLQNCERINLDWLSTKVEARLSQLFFPDICHNVYNKLLEGLVYLRAILEYIPAKLWKEYQLNSTEWIQEPHFIDNVIASICTE